MSNPFDIHGQPNDQSSFEPVPGGIHVGGLAALVWSPNMPGYQGAAPQDQITFVWIVPAQLDNSGQPKQIRRFCNVPNNPMHSKANIRQLVQQWLGRELTEPEIRNFQLERLLTRRCQITTQIATSQTTGRQYAKVVALAPPPLGLPPFNFAGIVVQMAAHPGQTASCAPGVTFQESSSPAQSATPAATAPAAYQPPPAAPLATPPQPTAPPAPQPVWNGTQWVYPQPIAPPAGVQLPGYSKPVLTGRDPNEPPF